MGHTNKILKNLIYFWESILSLWLFMARLLFFPNNTTAISSLICDEDTIAKYNTANKNWCLFGVMLSFCNNYINLIAPLFSWEDNFTKYYKSSEYESLSKF